MHEIAREARLFRFGAFELAAGTGELQKEGKRVSRLQAQPLQVLLILLERPGEVVTRDELRQRIWASETFVDFDHGVNTAVNKLRNALGESASSPRFIETLPRIGYRFIANVEALDAGSLSSEPKPETPLPTRTLVTRPFPENAAASERTFLSQPEDLPAAPHRLTRSLFFLVQLLYLGFYIAALARLPEAQSRLGGLTSHAFFAYVVLILTAAAGIPVRLYLLSAIAFNYDGLTGKFQKIFPYVFALDEIWALSPFLVAQDIGLGLALAGTAALLYLPFAQRSLLLMSARAPVPSGQKKR